MHMGPAPLPGLGAGGEEGEGLQQLLSSSGWSHRLGRCTGTPPARGISGITAGREKGMGVTAPQPGAPCPSPTRCSIAHGHSTAPAPACSGVKAGTKRHRASKPPPRLLGQGQRMQGPGRGTHGGFSACLQLQGGAEPPKAPSAVICFRSQ